MKTKIQLLLTLLVVLFFTCKKESNPRIIDPYSEIRNWIHTNGGSYKNKVISVEYNKATIAGKLNWTQVKEIAYMDDGYIYIPFTFSLHGKETEILPAIHSGGVPGASFSLLLHVKGEKISEIVLNNKLHSVEFLQEKATIENYYSSSGDWINSWIYRKNHDPQKIVVKAPEQNNINKAPTCTSVPIITYHTQCYFIGPGDMDYACKSVPQTTYYTLCDDGSTSGYSPTGGGSTGNTWGTGGSTSGGTTVGDDSPTPNSGKLCGNYNLQLVGKSYTGTIKYLQYNFFSSTKGTYIINFIESCLSIPYYNISKETASTIFNRAYNSAIAQTVDKLNSNAITPVQFRSTLKTPIQQELNYLKPGSTWSTAACSGNLPVTEITDDSYCID